MSCTAGHWPESCSCCARLSKSGELKLREACMDDSSLLFEASAVRASVRSRAMGVPVEACVSDWSSCDSALLAALLVDADRESDL